MREFGNGRKKNMTGQFSKWSWMKPTNRLFLSEVIVVMGILNY
jgi:hypothetical protein